MRIDKPLDKETLLRGDLAAPGEYDFEVVDAQERKSKAGNDMIEMQVRVFEPNGRTRVVFDYLLGSMEFKLAHFAETIGLFDKYSAGELQAQDCIGKSGRCKVFVRQDKTGQYPDKNAIADYLLSDAQQVAKDNRKKQEAGEGFIDDDLPF